MKLVRNAIFIIAVAFAGGSLFAMADAQTSVTVGSRFDVQVTATLVKNDKYPNGAVEFKYTYSTDYPGHKHEKPEILEFHSDGSVRTVASNNGISVNGLLIDDTEQDALNALVEQIKGDNSLPIPKAVKVLSDYTLKMTDTGLSDTDIAIEALLKKMADWQKTIENKGYVKITDFSDIIRLPNAILVSDHYGVDFYMVPGRIYADGSQVFALAAFYHSKGHDVKTGVIISIGKPKGNKLHFYEPQTISWENALRASVQLNEALNNDVFRNSEGTISFIGIAPEPSQKDNMMWVDRTPGPKSHLYQFVSDPNIRAVRAEEKPDTNAIKTGNPPQKNNNTDNVSAFHQIRKLWGQDERLRKENW